MKKLLVASLALVACLAIGGVAASAATVHRYHSAVTIHYSPATTYSPTARFHGKVKSGHARCIPHRKVVVFKKRPGADKKIGSDFSNAAGRWRVNRTFGPYAQAHKYYAIVRRHRLNQHHICKRAVSATITAP